MNSDELPADTLALILTFYRTPLRYPGLRQGHGDLPEEMTLLLRVAGGEVRLAGQQNRLPGAGAEKIRKAALFFVEQVCLVSGASHYRVLGLEAGAGERQIKEHHRLLMRIFHPDRREARDDWTDAYATRINQAYNVLRRPAQRRAYDASLFLADEERQRSPSQGARHHRLRRLIRLPVEHSRTPSRLPRAWRRRFPRLILVGLVSFQLMLGIYLLHGRTVPDASVAMPVSVSLVASGLPLADLNELVGQYVGAYERGDLEGLMALFGEKDGTVEIKNRYRKFFTATRSRRMVLRDLRWRRQDDLFSGDGSFLVELWGKEDSRSQNRAGRIRFEVGEQDGELSFHRIYHAAN